MLTNRPRFLALSLTVLTALALSCTSHQRSPASPNKASPAAAEQSAVAMPNTAATTAASKAAAPARGAALPSRRGIAQRSPRDLEAAARAEEQAKTMAAGGGPFVMQAVGFGESPAVRDLPPTAVETDLTDEDREALEGPDNPQIRHAVPSAKTAGKKADAAIQSELAVNAIPAPITSFDGLNNTDNFNNFGGRVNPSDDNGDVGPNHYVQQINLLVRAYFKNGAPASPIFKLSSLWAGVGGRCAAQDAGDPVVLYDALSDRWLLSQFAFVALNVPPYHQCVAISKTADPAGAYYLYDFVTAGNEFPDYPKLGVWPDGYYMMVHQFTLGGPFNGTGFYALDRKKMLVGDPTASYIYFNFNLASHPEAVGGSLPSDLDGLNPPPLGRPNTFAYFTSTHYSPPDPADGIRLFDFHADFANPGLSTFTERPETTYAAPLAVAAFDPTSPAPGGNFRRGIPQPPPTTVTAALDPITDRFLHRMAYRNFGDHESLIVNHTVGAPASPTFGVFRAAPRYYELRRPLPGGNFVVQEQATLAPGDGVSRWMGSAAMDGEGNLAVGYNVSSTTVFPGIRYAGRLASDPPGGLFQGENTLIAGTGLQTTTNNRWGDYSSLTIDPSDDCTFWYTSEYYTAASQATSTAGWLTRIGTFKVNPGCVSPPRGKLTGTITYCDSGLPVPNALVEVSDGHTAPTVANGTYSIDLSPGTYTVNINASSCSSAGPFTVNITDGGTTTLNTCLSGTPKLVLKSETVTGGNGNGIIDKNECNDLFVTLGNIGCKVDTGITATLSTSTPEVTVDTDPFTYADINEGAMGTNTLGMKVSTSPSFACGTPINFTLTVNDSTGAHVFPFTKNTCLKPTINISGSIAAGDPTQTGRLSRSGIPSVCGTASPLPPLVDTVLRRYDTYPFTNDGDVSACVTVNVTSGCSTNIFYVVYAGSFNPANIQENYRADGGASFAGTATFSFDVPAHSTYVLVVHESTNPPIGCASYTGNISGLFSNTDGGGACPPFLTALSPAEVWLGLKNSDDVGTKFDLKAEIYRNATLIGLGETLNVPGGSSGFNNAVQRTIDLARTANHISFGTGDSLSIKLYARIAATSGHRSGTARLWFNDAQADTEFDATIGGVTNDWYIRTGGGLETTPGPGPKKTIDVFGDRLVGGNPYKLFGTWTHTF